MDEFTCDALHQAAKYDDFDFLKRCLTQEKSLQKINCPDDHGFTPLLKAIEHNSSRCLKKLLECGAEPNLASDLYDEETCGFIRDMTPMHLAVTKNKFDLVKCLLLYDIDLALKNGDSLTAEDIAKCNGYYDIINLIQEEIMQRTEKLNSCKQQFIDACRNGDVRTANDLADQILDFDTFINEQIGNTATLLYNACDANMFDTVVLLIGKGADLSIAHATTGQLPIHVACKHKKKLLHVLLSRFPASVNIADNFGCLPVHIAASEGDPKVLKYLLDYQLAGNYDQDMHIYTIDDDEYYFPFDINTENKEKKTPLQVACENNQAENADVLLSFQVPVISKDDKEPDAFSMLEDSDECFQSEDSKLENPSSEYSESEKGQIDVISLDDIDDIKLPDLPAKKINPVKPNYNGKNPLFSAVKRQSMKVAEVLLKHGADPNKSQVDGEKLKSPLLVAAWNCDLDMMDLLLAHRAQDYDDCQLSVAISRPHPNMISTLLKYKTFKDEEYHINKQALKFALLQKSEDMNAITESIPSTQFKDEVYPRVPVAVNWRNDNLPLSKLRIERGDIEKEEWLKEWLIDAATHHNPGINKSIGSTFALYSITRLCISDNRLHYIPDYIFSLASLHVLDVSGNAIKELPEFLPGYYPTCLTELHLAENHLKTLPCWLFSHMSAITKLDASDNEITQVPGEMWTAPSLKELDLSENQLCDLPKKKFCSFKGNVCGNLPEIELTDNDSLVTTAHTEDTRLDTSSIPRQQFSASSRSMSKTLNWKDIERHNIWESRIVHIEDSNELPNADDSPHSKLTELNLSHNKFMKIPQSLPCLASKLTVLNMSHNNLTEVGHPSSYPPNIEKLDLSSNSITEIMSYPGMFYIDLECFEKEMKKRSSTLSSTARSRCSMESERVSRLNYKCLHRSQDVFKDLHTLSLNANRQLSHIQLVVDPNPKWSQTEQLPPNADLMKSQPLLFPNLSTLDLSQNPNLTELPKEIGRMKSLNQLLLQQTMIKTLPTEIGELPNLWNIDLGGCHFLTGQLKHLVEEKSETSLIRGYLKSLHLQETVYNRLTMMVVGPQKVGKTAMLEQLRHREHNSKIIQKTRAERLGFEKVKRKEKSGNYVPTDGVDINTLIMKHDKVHIRTWDFGGQKNFYATHQYFLSSRALYVVVWNISQDLDDGLKDVHQWLVNIQARASNSPVIIVGTYKDLIPSNKVENLLISIDKEINERFVKIADPSREGLPVVVGHIEICCKSSIFGGNKMIDQLSSLIQTTIKSKKDGTGQPLLGQKIPQSYVDLEDIVVAISNDRSKKSLIPIVEESRYKAEIQDQMRIRKRKSFDPDELRQATKFLNSYGVILHYDDPSLSKWYFLDPQWLCDMLATMMSPTIGQSWKMHIDNLVLHFKDSKYNHKDMHKYVISLLSKFELALQYDESHFLIAPLLPTELELIDKLSSNDPTGIAESWIPLKVFPYKCESIDVSRLTAVTRLSGSSREKRTKFYVPLPVASDLKPRSSSGVSIEAASHMLKKTCKLNPAASMIRLYLMSYFPSGFWPRLITRLLGDEPMTSNISQLYVIPDDIQNLIPSSGKAEWLCYQTGLELVLFGRSIVLVREITSDTCSPLFDYHKRNMVLCVDTDNSSQHQCLNLKKYSVLEILIPHYEMQFYRENSKPIFIHQDHCYSTKILANIVLCIDNLLEDWYPNVNGRFRQMSDGMNMVFRIVPCINCCMQHTCQNELSEKLTVGVSSIFNKNDQADLNSEKYDDCQNNEKQTKNLYVFTVEYCIDHVQSCRSVVCPVHDSLADPCTVDIRNWYHFAPDLAFLDLPDSQLISNKKLLREKLLSSGGFGVVYKATLNKTEKTSVEVAWKLIELVHPGRTADATARNEYEAKLDRLNRDPLRRACESYLFARHECSIMTQLNHEHIVKYIGLCVHPVSLILELAPCGELSSILKNFMRNGASLPVFAISQIIIKISSALEYLHSKSIHHRDLKSSNVMVWSMPLPHQDFDPMMAVSVKLSDYGISRFIQTQSSKGYAGTAGYMAPEIIRHMGEDCYNEKVDCFSFGMFIYELLTLRQPYENEEPKAAILNNARPFLSNKCWNVPTHILDLMALCWCDEPNDRPSAKEIHQISKNPQFCHMMSAVSFPTKVDVNSAVTVIRTLPDDDDFDVTSDLWLASSSSNSDTLEVISYENQQPRTIMSLTELNCKVCTMCQVNEYMWCASQRGTLSIYCLEEYEEKFSFSLSVDKNPTYHATNMLFLKDRQQVLLTMTDGQFIVCNAFGSGDACMLFEEWLDQEPILKRFGDTRKPNLCLAVFPFTEEQRLEIWCGQDRGVIQIWNYDDTKQPLKTLNHFNPINEHVKSYFIVSSPDDNKSLWSYVCPGNHVFRWDGTRRWKVAVLDCSKCIPIENKDIIKKHINNGRLQAAHCQVTALNVLYNEVYIGTTWGCIIIADKNTMRPITTIRCHSRCENYVNSILSIPIIDVIPKQNGSTAEEVNYHAKEAILTVGRGYRNLMRLTKAFPREMQMPKYKSDIFVLTFFSEDWQYY
ncbi:leucine-rich repeat serine/threonine-protein kinase 1-like [Tubulanus polymorphus]|uniref:leucine-rich repeat serine/threonine-protein kinase 1-like n=1 Tax=Tubulanus polymorphus TaxID=672921 RepID=UPI003DA2E3A3